MEINSELQHYFSSENEITTFCNFLKWSVTSIMLYDLENQDIDVDEVIGKEKIFSSCVSTYYANKVDTTNFETVDNFLDFLNDTRTKINKLQSVDTDQFWVGVFYKLADKIDKFISNALLEQIDSEVIYHKMHEIEKLMLDIHFNNIVADIADNQFKSPFYGLAKNTAFEWLDGIKTVLDQEIYVGYNYSCTNGILNSYVTLANVVNMVEEYIERVTIPELKVELYDELHGLYKRYLDMLQSNETFVNTNIRALHDIHTTILKLYVDMYKRFPNVDKDDVELVISKMQGKITDWFEHTVRNVLKQSCFDTDGLVNVVSQIYNPNLELSLNKTIFVKVIKNLVNQLKNMILTQEVMMFKYENGIKLNNMVQQLQNDIVEIINQNKMSDKSFEFVTNTFASISLMTIYILTKPNLKDRSDEQKWEDRFLERFHDKSIYTKLYQAKYKSIAVTTKLTDVSIELAEAGKVTSADLLNKSQVQLGVLKSKATIVLNNASTNVQNVVANAYLFPEDNNK